MKKATATAPSNIAFIKYWGRKDEKLRIPTNGSISMNLSNLLTTTTVAFDESLEKDEIEMIKSEKRKAKSEKQQFETRIIEHLDRIRKLAGITAYAKVISENNFPSDTGLSSSASGFAALTLAAATAAGLKLTEKELSILARQGSGSAARSIPDGFVEWFAGDSNESSYAVSIFPPEWFDIIDIVAIVSTEKKYIPTAKGHTFAQSSPLFEKRLENIDNKISECKKFIQEQNFEKFGELIEKEAIEMQSIMTSSTPPLSYLLPQSQQLLNQIKQWRSDGLSIYFTFNTGQNIHVICRQKDTKKVSKLLKSLAYVLQIIENRPAIGARLLS
ncbi:MAG TPA: diphosphomevalonate decarboxylase [Candidatus Saccharimonadales bacterium]|nr:diphosphomevalonate decarboxylase [Candidatus Saccharimonadales bacterium]